MIARREVLASLAALPWFGSAVAAAAQSPDRIARAPIWLRDDRLWIPVGVGAVGPFDFIVDTGHFMNMMDARLVEQLGLRLEGSLRITGLGGGDRFMVYKANDVRLGEVQVGTMRFAAFGADVPLRAAGLLSAALFTAGDTDFDFDAGEWRLHVDGRSDRAGFERLPAQFVSGEYGDGAEKLKVEVELDGRRYWLHLDTGSPGDIMLLPGATGRSGLWNDATPFAPHRRRGLVGDGGAGRLVRVPQARIGGLTFERPLVSLTEPGAGHRVDDVDGLLGLGLIQRMNLSTDTRARQLWARRNARPPRPERYGLSGLWLTERDGRLVIEAVGFGSPAAEAGLSVGDRITGGTLAEWIRRLAGRPGQTVEIPYVRGGAAATARITLREYL